MIIDGKKIAQKIYDDIKETISILERKPSLGVILVGNNPASLRYIRQKEKWAKYLGIKFNLIQFKNTISQAELVKEIKKININQSIDGFMIQLPLPKEFDISLILNSISPEKDVDGFHPINQGKILIGDNSGLIPCTPAGIMEILKSENINLQGKVVCVIGRSNIVGKPITALLINAGATVISCNSKTKHLEKYTKDVDIIIVATGQPGLIKQSMINDTSILIDVGFTVIDGKIYGDIDTKNIKNKITPVPGGVGALTVAMLMKNTLKAYNKTI